MKEPISKKGKPRKSRRQRLPVSSTAGIDYNFEPTETDWKRIGGAYPFLSRTDREAITGIVNEYLLWEPNESNAPFLDDAMDWLNRGEKAARKFSKAVGAFLKTIDRKPKDHQKRNAIFFAQRLVEENIGRDTALRGVGLYALERIMSDLLPAFVMAGRDAQEKAAAGFVEGQCWDSLVCDLRDFAKSKNYSVTASRGVDKSASPKTSPFVAFVRELQNTFPAVFRRHNGSDMALAQAISVALRNREAAAED